MTTNISAGTMVPGSIQELMIDWPPSVPLAELHAECLLVGVLDEDGATGKPIEYCRCCGMGRQPDRLSPWCRQVSKVRALGVTTLLYFQFLKQMTFLCTTIFLVYGAYSLVTDIFTVKLDTSEITTFLEENKTTVVVLLGITKKLTSQTDNFVPPTLIAQAWLGLFLTFLLIIQIAYLRIHFQDYMQLLDAKLLSPADYTVLLSGLPFETGYTQEQLMSCLTQFISDKLKLPVKIHSLTMAYSLQKFTEQGELSLQLSRQIRDVQIAQLQGQPSPLSPNQLQHVKSRLQQSLNYLSRFKNLQLQRNDPGYHCFVTFQTIEMATMFLTATKKSWAKRHIIDGIKKLLGMEVGLDLIFKHRQLQVQRAPEPRDVNWQNSGVDSNQVLMKRGLSYFLTLGLLGLSFMAIFFLSMAQATYSYTNQQSLVLSLAISVVVNAINQLIKRLLLASTRFQRAFTQSQFSQHLAIKIVLAQALNSIAVLSIVGWFIKFKRYGIGIFFHSGLTQDCFLLSITTCFLPTALALFLDWSSIYGAVSRCWYARQVSKDRCLLTQRQLNTAFQQPRLEFSSEYATVVSIVLYVSYYTAMQPIVSFFGMLGIFLYRNAKRHLIFTRYSRPNQLGGSLNEAMIGLVDLAPLLFSIGGLVCMNVFRFYAKLFIPNIIAVAFAAFNLVIPFSTLLTKLLARTTLKDALPYTQALPTFVTDYERQNPVTRQQALSRFVKMKGARGQLQPPNSNFMQMLNKRGMRRVTVIGSQTGI